MSQDVDLSPSLSAFIGLANLLINSDTQLHIDRDAATILQGVNPMSGGLTAASPDLWDVLFNRCLISGSTDTLVIRIYRLGLIRTANTLRDKKFLDKARYGLARAAVSAR